MTNDPAREYSAEDVAQLRDRLNDFAGNMALSAQCTGAEPAETVNALLDALVGMLRLGFACVRLHDPERGRSIEMVRVDESLQDSVGARQISQAMDSSFGDASLQCSSRTQGFLQSVDLSVASVPLGLRGEIGIIVAGSSRSNFPTQTERLLLDLAADQATIGLQHARLRRESERESRLMVDSIPGLVATLTPSGTVDAVNNRMLEYFGKTLSELKQWHNVIHPDDLARVIQIFRQAMASGDPHEYEVRLRRFDGVYRWFQLRGLPLRDATRRVARWYVLITEIDDLKRAEEAIRASERNLKLIIDTIPALAWSARPDGSAEYFNQHYLDFIGFSAEEARGWGWTAAVHPADLNDLVAAWQRITASGALGETEARLRRHDGAYRWFLFRANPLRDETGAIVKWYGVNTDLEDRKRAEAGLRGAYGRLAEAQRLSKTGSFITDLLADEPDWSEEAFRIFEVNPETTITLQAIREVVYPEDLPVYDAAFTRASEGLDWDLAFRITTASGNLKHLHAVGRVMEKVEGRPVLIGALQDVTESVVAEGALNRARAELAHVARAMTLGALTASIAHEVNQPLSGIITNASTCLRMLSADPPNLDGARSTAQRTLRDGNRASEVIQRLRAMFARKEPAIESVDLNHVAREVLALSSSEIQRSRVILRTDFDAGLPAVSGDYVQLQQVVMNLVVNAVDAMKEVNDRPRDLIVATTRESASRVRVFVRDSGAGIDPRILPKLFDPFFTTKAHGMGVGLSISRSIIEGHEGRIWASLNDGPGATFSFSIPCRSA
jgi:PAS domain S-box-containing protein